MAAEVRRHGGTIDQDAAAFLVQAVGQDLRSLSAAAAPADQRLPGEPLTVERGQAVLRRPGRGEVVRGRRRRVLRAPRGRSRSCAGRSTPAPPPVLVTARSPAARAAWRATSGARAGMREADLAREVGVPPWKLRTVRDQSRGWSDAGHRPGDPGDRPGRRRHQGRGQRRVVHPGAAGAHRHRPARADAADARKCDGPAETRDGSAGERWLRARRPSWRSPTCGWRPGSCG